MARLAVTRPRVVVVGSANIDITVRADRLPSPGETVLGTSVMVAEGGKGLNQAVTAARLGAEVALIGSLGDDEHGDRLRARLRDEGIDIRSVLVGPVPTGTAHVTVDARGDNVIVVVPGANAVLAASDVDRVAEVIEMADVLLASLEVPLDAVARAGEIAHAAGVRTVLNPAPAIGLPAGFDVIVPNETEAAALGLPGSAGGADVVVTLGDHGALWVEPGGRRAHDVAPVAPPAVVDSTAAGDAFCGALAVALAEGRGMPDALAFAAAAGAWAVSVRGAVPSLPRRADVAQLLGQR